MSDRDAADRRDAGACDSDTDDAVLPGAGSARPVVALPLTPGSVALVAVGGAAGALLRHGLGAVLPAGGDGALPWATLTANLSGAFLLGAVLGVLAGGSARLRLLLGTGFLGGLTTYSALAVETVTLLAEGRTALSLGYAGGSVVLGILACAAGLRSAERLWHRRKRPRR